MDRNAMVLGSMSGSGAVHPRIARQRTELVLSQPFFGALALRLKVREDPHRQDVLGGRGNAGLQPGVPRTP